MPASNKQPPFFIPTWKPTLAQWQALTDFEKALWNAWSKGTRTRLLDMKNRERTGLDNFQGLGTNLMQVLEGGQPFQAPPGEPTFYPVPFVSRRFEADTTPLLQLWLAAPIPGPSTIMIWAQVPGQTFNPTPTEGALFFATATLPAGGSPGDAYDGLTLPFVHGFGNLWEAVNCQLKLFLFQYSQGQSLYLGNWTTIIDPTPVPRMSQPVVDEVGDTDVTISADGSGPTNFTIEWWMNEETSPYSLVRTTASNEVTQYFDQLYGPKNRSLKTRWTWQGEVGPFSEPVSWFNAGG